MSTTMGVQKYRWKIVIYFAMSKIIRHFAPFCLSPPPPLFRPTSVVLMPMAETKKYQGRTDQPTVWLGSMLKTLVCHSFVWERWNSLKYCFSLFFPLHFLCSWEAWEISYSRWSTRSSPNSRRGGGRLLLLFLWLTSVCRSKAMKGSLIIFPMKTS